MKKVLKYILVLILLILLTASSVYFLNERIIKFYEEEPYPLFESDFTDINTTGYLFDPKARYDDYTLGPVYNITEYGAVDGYYDEKEITEDIIDENTDAINQALKDASQSGGVVLIPEGDYVMGTIKLKSNVTVRLNGNLIGSRKRSDYSPENFLIGDGIRNVTIEGNGGKIMGEGEYFWNNPILKPLKSNLEVSDVRMLQLNHFLAKREKKANRPSPFILFKQCRDILIRNLLVNNSPGWTLTFEISDNITVRDTVLHNNIRGGNVDGIDIVATSNVNIKNILVSTADDGIALKNPKREPSVSMENITVRNARITSTCNSFKIGTETYADISNVIFADSEILTTEFYPGGISGVSIESVDGSKVSKIYVDNITMRGVLAPLFIRVGNRNKYGGEKDLISHIDDVHISNLYSYDCQLPSIISGVKVWNWDSWDYTVLKATNVDITNFHAEYLDTPERLLFHTIVPEHPSKGPEVWMFGDVPAYGIYIRHADVEYKNVDITPRTGNTREEIIVDTCSFERNVFSYLLITVLVVGILGLIVFLTFIFKAARELDKAFKNFKNWR
ncbi:MAG: glycoside hydrolase family 28 protein [Promethearchaeia archaeon]